MKLTNEQLLLIEKYIDGTLINKEDLIEYLEKHRTVKNDVFRKCAKRGKNVELGDEDYCGLLDHPRAFSPVTREVFIRRIPFLFHCPTFGSGNKHRSGLWRIIPRLDKDSNPEDLESLYCDLEFMYYKLHIDLESIFNYANEQVFRQIKEKNVKVKGIAPTFPDYSKDEMFSAPGEMTRNELFNMWRHYLRLCDKLGRIDYLPERFLTAYNYLLEEVGCDPIIYRPLVQYGVEYFSRHGSEFVCKGNFPCDAKGRPIMRWTSIKVENAKSITFSGAMSRAGTLRIEIQPDTTIHLLGEDNLYDEESAPDDEWHQIYAGPQNMEFNYKALKEFRVARGFTQKEVADAIGANIRTYQKWEGSSSTPDGHYLLRIMNWLQIDDVQDLIFYRGPNFAKTED